MSEFILIAAILFSILGFAWSSRTLLNCTIKTGLFGMVAWAAYLMFGPANLIAQFAK